MITIGEACKQLLALRRKIKDSDVVVVELMAHPQANANAIMRMHEMMVQNRTKYREVVAVFKQMKGAQNYTDSYCRLSLDL
jgi:hypothetical protein